MLERWASNDVSTLEEREVQIALEQAYGPRVIPITDENTGESTSVILYPPIPRNIQELMDQKGYEIGAPTLVDPDDLSPRDPDILNPMRLKTPENVTEPVTGQTAIETETEVSAGEPLVRTMAAGPGAPGTIADAYSPVGETFFNVAADATGFANVSEAWLARQPILGEIFKANEQIPAQQYMRASINRVVRGLAETERYGFLEKTQMLRDLEILPQLFDQPDALRLAIVGLDSSLLQAQTELFYTANDRNVSAADRRMARRKLADLRMVRNILGAPPRVYSEADFNRLPIGSPYLVNGFIRTKTDTLPD
jgi:hypothetical protein